MTHDQYSETLSSLLAFAEGAAVYGGLAPAELRNRVRAAERKLRNGEAPETDPASEVLRLVMAANTAVAVRAELAGDTNPGPAPIRIELADHGVRHAVLRVQYGQGRTEMWLTVVLDGYGLAPELHVRVRPHVTYEDLADDDVWYSVGTWCVAAGLNPADHGGLTRSPSPDPTAPDVW